jgi:hypothetical protein
LLLCKPSFAPYFSLAIVGKACDDDNDRKEDEQREGPVVSGFGQGLQMVKDHVRYVCLFEVMRARVRGEDVDCANQMNADAS